MKKENIGKKYINCIKVWMAAYKAIEKINKKYETMGPFLTEDELREFHLVVTDALYEYEQQTESYKKDSNNGEIKI